MPEKTLPDYFNTMVSHNYFCKNCYRVVSIKRQLTDIQIQAGRLLDQSPDLSDLETFAQFNDELKSYLLENIQDDFVKGIVARIPDVFEKEDEKVFEKKIIGVILSFLTSGISSYFREKRKKDNALEAVREIRGKYASIEFLLRNRNI